MDMHYEILIIGGGTAGLTNTATTSSRRPIRLPPGVIRRRRVGVIPNVAPRVPVASWI